MHSLTDFVRTSLAQHLHIDPATLSDDQELADLDVSPLDLVWLAMRVEAFAPGSDEVPVEILASARTVGELVDAFDDWSSERDTLVDMPMFTLDHEPVSQSDR